MKRALRTLLVILAWVGCYCVALGDDYPFPVIAHLPERRLFGADKYGHPHIEEKDKAEVARLATSPGSPPDLKFMAVWGLAISGYSSAAAAGLIKAVADGDPGTRGYAAMGLRNFTMDLPVNKKEEFRTTLKKVLTRDGLGTPNEVIRVLITWGDAAWIFEQLGSDLAGHGMEIEILQELPATASTPRLLEIYRTTQRENSGDSYNQRAKVGRALADFRDKRGIDILESLLDAASVPTISGGPNHQYRHNVFFFILKAVGNNFGYEHLNYDPSIDAAIVRFREWWFQERYQFEFPKE